MKKSIIFALVVASQMSCSKDKNETSDSSLVGKWLLVESHIEKYVDGSLESTEILSGDGLTHSMLTFNADFTYYVEYEEYEQGEEFIESESGRYTNTDKTITLFINGGDEGRAAEYEIVSGQLHIVLFDKETGQDDEGKPIREIETGVYERQ